MEHSLSGIFFSTLPPYCPGHLLPTSAPSKVFLSTLSYSGQGHLLPTSVTCKVFLGTLQPSWPGVQEGSRRSGAQPKAQPSEVCPLF